jgi:hypothetical protein
MSNESRWIAIYIERIFSDMVEQLKALPDVLNRPMPVPDANTLFAIGTHSVGMAEFWVLELVGGQNVQRDRAAEFRAAGKGSDLIARIERFIPAMHALLDDLPESRMDEEISTRGFSARDGDAGRVTVREALLHVVEHTATHLGHFQLTADYFRAQTMQD